MNYGGEKTALVTGGSGGIGAAVAERLARDGFAVVVHYASNEAAATAVVRRIESANGRAISLRADISRAAAVARMFEDVEAKFGGLDVLVNSAGIMKLKRIAETDEALFEETVGANLRGTFNTLRLGARRLRQGGRIINFSTSVVQLKFETYGIYTATKAAVEALTGILSKELRGRSITVNAVSPGPTATKLFLEGKPQSVIDAIAKANPMERLATPEDIAGVVAFLAGPDGAWVNGQVIRANGGMV